MFGLWRCALLVVLPTLAEAANVKDSKAAFLQAKDDPAQGEEEKSEEALQDVGGLPSAMSSNDNVLQYESGVDNAKHWNQEVGWFTRTWHVIDVVASSTYKFLYVENIRGGSWAIEQKLMKVLGATVLDPDAATNGTEGTGASGFSSNDFSDGVTDLFKFSVVLDPVTKFEAGVRATWKIEGEETYTADEMLAEQLHNCNITSTCEWTNEELQPSSWRLSTWAGGSQIWLDFIGKIETIENDWPGIVASLTGLSDEQKAELADLGHPQPAGSHDGRSLLSTESIQKMCASEIYGSEWDYFNYAKPEVCV